MSKSNQPQPSTSKQSERSPSPPCQNVETKEKQKGEDKEDKSLATYVEALDIGSENFDPLQALFAPELKLPDKKCKIYENFAAFESALRRLGLYGMGSKKMQKAQEEARKAKQEAEAFDIDNFNATRRFLPHQMAIQTKYTPRAKNVRNIFKIMEKVTGPQALLYDCVKNEKRVKVYTRSLEGIRGHMTGILIAFDKHWNLLMKDVCETYKRRKYKYGANKIVGEPTDCTERLKSLGITLPTQKVKSLNRKNVEITRHFGQMMMRGEDVVLVTVLKEDEEVKATQEGQVKDTAAREEKSAKESGKT